MYLVGSPRGRDLALQRLVHVVPFGGGEIGPVAPRQEIGDAALSLTQCATYDLGRVSGEDQLDPKLADVFVQSVGLDPRLHEP